MTLIDRIFTEKNVAMVSLTISGSISAYLYACDSIGMKYYVKYFQAHRNGEPVPVRNTVKFQFQAVLEDMKISKYSQHYYDLFITDNLDPITLGSTEVKQGIRIGVPEYFQLSSDESIKLFFKVGKESINWECLEGERLLQSLHLSDKAQKFALAKAAVMSENYYHCFRAILPLFMTSAFCVFCQKIMSLRKLHLRSAFFTVGTHFLSAVTFAVLYWFCSETLYLQYDRISNETVLDFSHTYMVGGIEYYEKKVERNKALRNLIRNGHKYFDEDGDRVMTWKPQGLPDSFKLIFAKEKLASAQSMKEALTPPPVNPNPHPIL